MTKRITIILILLSMTLLFALEPSKGAIGVHAGTSTGMGLSGLYSIDKSALQFTFFVLSTGVRDDNDSYTTFNMGLNYMVPLKEYRESRFYIKAGGAYYYQTEKEEFAQNWDTVHDYYLGVGPGFEFIPLRSLPELRFNVELPFTINKNKQIQMLVPAAGLYYHFM